MLENIDKKNNFQTFSNAMLILMRFATGEDWNAFMYEYSNQEDCNVSHNNTTRIYNILFRLIKPTKTSRIRDFKDAEPAWHLLTSFPSKF